MSQKEMKQSIPLDRALVVISKETLKKWEIKEVHYPKLENIIKTFGSWEVNCASLSREWNIPNTTIHRWKEEIMGNLSVTDYKEIMIDLKLTSIANIKHLQTLIRKKGLDVRIKIAAIKVYSDLTGNVIELLDRMGLTAKESKKLTLAAAYEEYEKEHGTEN